MKLNPLNQKQISDKVLKLKNDLKKPREWLRTRANLLAKSRSSNISTITTHLHSWSRLLSIQQLGHVAAGECLKKTVANELLKRTVLQLAYVLLGVIVVSAWSAAASDIYISSRFLFFLASNGHAPKIFAVLFKYPSEPERQEGEEEQDEEEDEEDILDRDDDELPPVIDISWQNPQALRVADASTWRPGHKKFDSWSNEDITVEVHPVSDPQNDAIGGPSSTTSEHATIHHAELEENEQPPAQAGKEPWLVLPFFAVIASASVGLLAFLDVKSQSGPAHVRMLI